MQKPLLNILHIGKFYPPFHGGMENYLCDLANEQVKQGHRVTAWVHNHDWGRFKSDTTRTVDGSVDVIRQKSLKPFLFTPIMLGFRKQLKQLIQQQQPDIIHLHWPNPSLFYLLTDTSFKNKPLLISWHSDMVTENSHWMMKIIYQLIRPLESKLIEWADGLLVSTQNYADHSPQLQKYAEKTTVIPLGIRTDYLKNQNPEHLNRAQQWSEAQWSKGSFRLFHLGRLTFYKNQKMLINAMSLLHDSQLIMAGDGQLKAKLIKQITRASLTSKVNLLGSQSVEHVHALFASCDVFCMASHDRAESFGVVLLEAMYHNKIILVPDTLGSGMNWLAENYNKGFIYQADNQLDFVDKVKYIRREFNQISKRQHQFSYEMYDVAQSVFELYEKIINRRIK